MTPMKQDHNVMFFSHSQKNLNFGQKRLTETRPPMNVNFEGKFSPYRPKKRIES